MSLAHPPLTKLDIQEIDVMLRTRRVRWIGHVECSAPVICSGLVTKSVMHQYAEVDVSSRVIRASGTLSIGHIVLHASE